LIKGLASGNECRYTTHSPCIPIMPLKGTNSSQILGLFPFIEPQKKRFYPPTLSPPYMFYPSGGLF